MLAPPPVITLGRFSGFAITFPLYSVTTLASMSYAASSVLRIGAGVPPLQVYMVLPSRSSKLSIVVSLSVITYSEFRQLSASTTMFSLVL